MNNNRITLIKHLYSHFGVKYFFQFCQKKESISIVDNQQKVHFNTLDDLKSYIMQHDICGLKNTARNTVFADGNPDSKIMILGEAPGESEDIQGIPFVGQSGQLLNNMLRSIGITRSDVYISNIVFWRPIGNRTPSSDEISACMPYVNEHIRFINPKILLLLGSVAAKAITNSPESITKMAGIVSKYMDIDVIATFHPAYLLRSPAQKLIAFRNMLTVKKLLQKQFHTHICH